MDSFESLVAMLIRREGFWVQQAFKANLTRKEKLAIGKPTSPRPELDCIAYQPESSKKPKLCPRCHESDCPTNKPRSNTVCIIECKTFLDSYGVQFKDLNGGKGASGYKLFNRKTYWRIVSKATVGQLRKAGLCHARPRLELWLVCGKVKNDQDREKLHTLFDRKKWILLDDNWAKEHLRSLAEERYEDDIATMVAKILERTGRDRNRQSVTGPNP